MTYMYVFTLFTIISFVDRPGQNLTETLRRSYGNYTDILKSTQSPHRNRKMPLKCPCGFPTFSHEPMIIFGPK